LQHKIPDGVLLLCRHMLLQQRFSVAAGFLCVVTTRRRRQNPMSSVWQAKSMRKAG